MRRALDILVGRPLSGLRPEVLLTLGIGGLLGLLIVPLPGAVLDVLVALNMAVSALILVAVLLSARPLAVSSFPTLLLITTLFRLGLNVSTTRMILGEGQAGEVVAGFGRFVARGDVVMGLVVFLILTLVQLLVIGRGAERVAEVGARFTLDALPGKQMSIDAGLRTGALSEEEAEARREELGRESQFYGAMDGAMKFVKGDATIGLVVTALNLGAGMVIGVTRLDLALPQAVETFSLLTIGDGLVAQIPSLLIALAAGLLTTRVAARGTDGDLGRTLQTELLHDPKALGLAAAFALGLALVPGLPTWPFGLMASGLALGAIALGRRRGAATGDGADAGLGEELERRRKVAEAQKAVADQVAPTVHPLVVNVSSGLARALGIGRGADDRAPVLTVGIPQARDHVMSVRGVRLPGVRVLAAAHLPEGQIVVKVNDVPVEWGHVPLGRQLAFASNEELQKLGVEAEAAVNPLTSAPAAWVDDALAEVVEGLGVSVFSLDRVIALHVAAVGLAHADRFIGIEEVSDMVRRLRSVAPALVDELVPRVVSLAQIRDVLRRLVAERVSIRDFKTILEALGEVGDRSVDPVERIEHVRRALGLQLTHGFAGPSRRVSAIVVDEVVEDLVLDGVVEGPAGAHLALDPAHRVAIVDTVRRVAEPVLRTGVQPVVLTRPRVRFFLAMLLLDEPAAVVAYDELAPDVRVMAVGRVSLAAIERRLAA